MKIRWLLRVVTLLIWSLFLALALPDMWPKQLPEACLMLYGLWAWAIRDLWGAWTGRFYAVTLFIDGRVVMAERCAFMWSANALARRWATEFKALMPEAASATTERLIVVSASTVDML